MFVRDFIHVGQPFHAIAPRFLRDPAWLAPIVDEAIVEAAEMSRALGRCSDPADGSAASTGPTHAAGLLDQGPIRSRPRGIVVPISWRDVEDPDWFPQVSGDLEVAPIGLRRSELILWGRYQSDEPGAQRIVEASVRAFLQRLASTLEAQHHDTPA